MKVFIYIIMLFCAFFCNAQETYKSFDYSPIPPSPDVSSLIKYEDTPVSPFTGQPEISIPIYTIKEGSLEVPISIRYHGGIRADELPGLLGHGWSLIEGGSVSRTVYGYPDEAPHCTTEHDSTSHQRISGVLNLPDSLATDSRGITTRYYYDGFQRLGGIKDYNGNYIKSFNYFYKNNGL